MLFASLVVLSLFAELLSNDRPLVARYDGQYLRPAAARLLREDLRRRLRDADRLPRSVHPRAAHAGRQLGDLSAQPLRLDTLNYFAKAPNPAPPSRENWLRHRRPRARHAGAADLRLSRQRAVRAGADGHRHGARHRHRRDPGLLRRQTDLAFQRFIEIWGSMPELYLLIIFASIFEPASALLLILLSLFGWMGLSDYVRAEFLRNRQLDYVKAARALGLSQPADHLAPRPAEQHDAGDHLPAVPHERGDPGADLARLPRPGRAAGDALARRAAEPGQGQPRCLVDLAVDLRRAGRHAAAADLHRRRAARRARSAKGWTR